MTSRISRNVLSRLACSFCGDALRHGAPALACPGCGLEYPRTASGALDLRLKRPRKYGLEFQLGTPLSGADDLQIEPLKAASRPQVDFAGMGVPHHMTRELMSYFPQARSADSLLLDLGCGNAVHRRLCEGAGFEWVGADCDAASHAPILADAHALPFQDESFECILSVAAMQLFQFPFVMTSEAYRVLKPHGVFLGTVAFLEPFHDQSFYHHTHLGTLNSLQHGGFKVEKLAPSEEWSALTAQASMSLFPKMPRFMSRSIVYPVELLHKFWWAMGSLVTRNPNADKGIRIRNTTAAFAFVASKGAA